jgi:hypothetical protein
MRISPHDPQQPIHALFGQVLALFRAASKFAVLPSSETTKLPNDALMTRFLHLSGYVAKA